MKKTMAFLFAFFQFIPVFGGMKNYPLYEYHPGIQMTITRETDYSAATGLDSVLFLEHDGVNVGATGVFSGLFADITTAGTTSGVGHTIGVLGLNRGSVGNQQYLYGVEGRVNAVSQVGSALNGGVLGLSQWASDVSTGTTQWMIGLHSRAEIFQADEATERSTGTAVGVYVAGTKGGATKYGILQVGTTDVNYFYGPIYAAGGYRSISQIVVTANNGSGGVPATGTVIPTTDYLILSCSDPDGCVITMSETGAVDGRVLRVVGGSANTNTIADSSGVTDLAGDCVLGVYDSISLMYAVSGWIETGRSNN